MEQNEKQFVILLGVELIEAMSNLQILVVVESLLRATEVKMWKLCKCNIIKNVRSDHMYCILVNGQERKSFLVEV